MKKAAIPFLLLSVLCFAGCYSTVNRSIHLPDGEHSGGYNSVNGGIYVGSRCRVEGPCSSVNGHIEVGDESHVHDLNTVNGGLRLGRNVDVDGSAHSVNGSIDCGSGSKVHGKVRTVNGRIELRNTVVDNEISSVNGSITLAEKSVARGGIRIEGFRHNNSIHPQRLEIRIRDGSRVEGGIIVEDRDIEVTVYLSKDSHLDGEIRNARVVRE